MNQRHECFATSSDLLPDLMDRTTVRQVHEPQACLFRHSLAPYRIQPSGIELSGLFRQHFNRQEVLSKAVRAKLVGVLKVILDEQELLSDLPQVEEGIHDGESLLVHNLQER